MIDEKIIAKLNCFHKQILYFSVKIASKLMNASEGRVDYIIFVTGIILFLHLSYIVAMAKRSMKEHQ